MNVQLLREIQKEILAQPKRFHMATWINNSRFSDCGTTACIAGWAVIKDFQSKEPELDWGQCARKAKQLWDAMEVNPEACGRIALGLDYRQKERLFYSQYWPQQFRKPYLDAMENNEPVRAAQVASDRIDHFIATQGEE